MYNFEIHIDAMKLYEKESKGLRHFNSGRRLEWGGGEMIKHVIFKDLDLFWMMDFWALNT